MIIHLTKVLLICLVLIGLNACTSKAADSTAGSTKSSSSLTANVILSLK